MGRTRMVFLLTAVFFLGIIEEARACSSFLLTRQEGVVLGKNLDWNFGDGLVLVNRRGMTKTAAVMGEEPAMTWTSRFGSVTFNQYGRDFAHGGMNEAGLVLEVLWLDETQYPEPDQRFGLDSLQWVQHHLDVSATVAEVLAGDARMRIDPESAPLHFLVCDQALACAVIEFLDGRMIAHQGADLPVIALTNSPYRESVDFLKQCEGFGGEQPIGQSEGSLDRFVRAAAGVTTGSTAAESSEDLVAEAFDLLDDVAMPDCSQEECTQWSMVYDLGQEVIHFRTADNLSPRFIALSDFDFACASPVRMLDISAPGVGNVAALFTDYTHAANHALITAAFSQTDFLQDLPSEAIDYVAAYPERFTHCQ